MIRARLASMVMAVGMLFVCGCCCLFERPLFGRHRECCSKGEMVASGSPVVTEGPILMDSGPPTSNGTILNAPANAPQLSPPPRIYPQQAQPTPYQPTNRRGT